MRHLRHTIRTHLLAGAAASVLACSAGFAAAQDRGPITIAPQPLESALYDFGGKTGVQVLFAPGLAATKKTAGVVGESDVQLAMAKLLEGTGLTYRRKGDMFVIVQDASDPQSGSAAGDGADQGTVQALIVTAQKREENIQDVPIAMSAFTQEDLTRSQVTGGPDLMTQVPNFTFTKTNFSSYSIQIRGIGTQAISATVDPAVAVAFNNTPFIRNRFFEQEFYDLQRVEVLRGPQGTLYGRNATAGVVNIISQKPKFDYEARLSADVGNYNSTRLEGMVNIPLAQDAVALRIAGAWTKRDGYDTNQLTGNRIDGRDLWSTRVSLRVAPTDGVDANLVWEHFEENDDRLRSGKQLCHRDDRTDFGGYTYTFGGTIDDTYSNVLSQGCLPASLYSPDSYQAPNGYSLPYYLPLTAIGVPTKLGFNPYSSLVQSPDLRVIESSIEPKYRAKSDVVELQFSAELGAGLTLNSETGYNYDNIYSLEDFNRFNTAPGAFEMDFTDNIHRGVMQPGPNGAVFCDPQLGCSDRLVAVDVSTARSRQFSQEFRVSSDYSGAFNFSLGANFLRYDTEDKYYVFINTLTLAAARGGYAMRNTPLQAPWIPGVTDNHECLLRGGPAPNFWTGALLNDCTYIDPNPIGSVNDLGHNYFLSRNPFKLISYAVFGEAYYNITDSLKLTAGLRWTVDKKEAPRIPSWLLAANTVGYPVLEVVKQEWREPTGRLTLDWKPKLSFTDQTLVYASFAHGYKAGGANPPPAGVVGWALPGLSRPDIQIMVDETATKPKTFNPEFVNAYEIGTKNTLLDGRLTLNADAFFYDYKGYQVSQIIDRSAVNYNFDSRVWGLELEADWQPLENLRLGFKGGYEKTRVGDGARAIDIMDRTAGHSDWVVFRPFPSFPSNCVVPLYTLISGPSTIHPPFPVLAGGHEGFCEEAYLFNRDPATDLPYVPNPTVTAWVSPLPPNYPGWDPTVDYGNNHGEGFYKDLSGHELPNAPHFTATVTADYTIPLRNDWLVTLHGDFYYQSEAWTRIFNTPGYDKLKAYNNVNFAAIFSNEDAGWKVMAYVKNVFNKDNITGAFLNSDDTGLTTNVFLNEPRLYGLRVTKEWTGGGWSPANHGEGPSEWIVELGGSLAPPSGALEPVESAGNFTGPVDPANFQKRDLPRGQGGELRLTYAPAQSAWRVSTAVRYGRTKNLQQINARDPFEACAAPAPYIEIYCQHFPDGSPNGLIGYEANWIRGQATQREKHTLVDFQVGRDVGLGGLQSSLMAGVRYGDFKASTHLDTTGVPDMYLPDGWFFKYMHNHFYRTDLTGGSEFKGFGPTLTWDASRRLLGNETGGHLDVEGEVTGGVLFGKQDRTLKGTEVSTYYQGSYAAIGYGPKWPNLAASPPVTTHVADRRSNSATVPLVGVELGMAYKVDRVSLRAGYRWERYFNALDVGSDQKKEADRTIDGPYLKLSVGFGG